jgi:hypothetical protein
MKQERDHLVQVPKLYFVMHMWILTAAAFGDQKKGTIPPK